ncbi:MAG TPA: hypothetical protein VLG50_00130 [Candidatus Saccharimonadales bacterium]|nr:hypothetical protein [Candidatus Saccharimonadales bacterium]
MKKIILFSLTLTLLATNIQIKGFCCTKSCIEERRRLSIQLHPEKHDQATQTYTPLPGTIQSDVLYQRSPEDQRTTHQRLCNILQDAYWGHAKIEITSTVIAYVKDVSIRREEALTNKPETIHFTWKCDHITYLNKEIFDRTSVFSHCDFTTPEKISEFIQRLSTCDLRIYKFIPIVLGLRGGTIKSDPKKRCVTIQFADEDNATEYKH